MTKINLEISQSVGKGIKNYKNWPKIGLKQSEISKKKEQKWIIMAVP